jgi:2-polyprenyl-3-methyl-5-hydroxy-6-metoxy-1,4-benzoquinol methylase
MNIKQTLIDLGICDNGSIVPYYPRVRDNERVSVLKCTKSGVIFLENTNHIDIRHYEEMDNLSYWKVDNRAQALMLLEEDTNRRTREFAKYVTQKNWVDIGTGIGAILDSMGKYACKISAVEPQRAARNLLQKLGYEVVGNTSELENEAADVVTLFHVFEHFTDPIGELNTIYEKVKPGGKLIIEIPHASDFLLSFLDHQAFKEFTLWSEHIILHTKFSLEAMLKVSNWKPLFTYGIQRYPLCNHLYWLAKNKPGGHLVWNTLQSPELNAAYENLLAKLDMTDTLVCIAEK